MYQKRYDDGDKQRSVKREGATKRKTTDDGTEPGTLCSSIFLILSFFLFNTNWRVEVSWYWSGDSKKGDKDVWVEYDHKTAMKLERAYKKSQKRTKLDSER